MLSAAQLIDDLERQIVGIERCASPTQLCGHTGLCPRVYQSGSSDRRGALAKHGPKYLRWALMVAATNAARTTRRLVAQLERLGHTVTRQPAPAMT